MFYDYEPRPYIGVTGFTTPEQVQAVLESVPENAFRYLMVGVLVNWQSLREEPQTPLTHKRFPDPRKIKNIFQSHEKALNLVHYNTNKEFADQTLEDLLKIHDLSGPYFHGFQLNIAWPDINVIHRYRRAVGSTKIVLQIGSGAFRQAGDTPEGLVNKLYPYIDDIDYILLDKSGGVGKPFDPEEARPYLLAIKEKRWGIGLGIAGGLSSDSLNLVEILTDDFPTISWDAEGLLRDSENELIINKTTDYIKRSYSLTNSLIR